MAKQFNVIKSESQHETRHISMRKLGTAIHKTLEPKTRTSQSLSEYPTNSTITSTLIKPVSIVNANTKNSSSHLAAENGGGRRQSSHTLFPISKFTKTTTQPHQKSYYYLLKIKDYLKRSNFLNLFLLFIISILTNSIYFNLYYLPNLHKTLEDQSGVKKLELTANSNGYFSTIPSLSSLITWSSSYIEHNYQNYYQNYRIKSYDHVSFASLDDGQFPDSDERFDKIIGLIEEDEFAEKKKLNDRREESKMALKIAIQMQKRGKLNKASKIFKYALSLDPRNPELLTSYGEYLELHKKDIVKAEHYYTKVINIEPDNNKANLNLRRASPIVSKIDRDLLDKLDGLLKRFYEIPSTNSALKRAKKDAYYMHIYHSNAIEGNTLNLQQTRHILENRMAVAGKSVQEHNEVLGLDAAMRYINQTLLYKPLDEFGVDDILQIHRRVLGYCDPIESGKFRKHQVYVGKFTPPSPEHVEHLMNEFIEWLNSNQLLLAHPIQIASLVHYKFVFIHPFYDGNGRTARLLMNLIMMKFGYPPVIIKKQDRLDYYAYLEMANQGDIKPFVRFIAKCTQRTLVEYIKLCNDSYSISVDDDSKMYRGDLILNSNDYFDEVNLFRNLENSANVNLEKNEGDNDDDDDDDVINEGFINTGKFSFAYEDNVDD